MKKSSADTLLLVSARRVLYSSIKQLVPYSERQMAQVHICS